MVENKTSYGNIFRTTFLFGFVQVFNIAIKVVLNKIVAIFLGAEGMGIIGIYHSAINLLKTGAGLGINQSSIRDISEANEGRDINSLSRTISLTNKIILFASLLGIGLTICFSPLLSKLYYGDLTYTTCFVWLSFVVGLNVLTEGKLAILKGTRRMHDMAYASMYGTFIGLIVAVPFYYFFEEGGIIPSLILTALSSFIFSYYYSKKIFYEKIQFTFSELFNNAKPIVKMGCALMFVSFISSGFDLVVAAFISRTGSVSDVGLYNAGAAIITSYFGVVITAMSTDYYPRISAIYKNNNKLEMELNRQSETGLIMIFPLVILFVFLSPFFIDFLYSKDFSEVNHYTDYAMIGTIITVVSNCMAMILLAKQASSIFITSVLIQRTLLLGVYLLAYKYLGLLGLGIGYIVLGVIHLLFMVTILHRFYNIYLNKRIYMLLALIITITISTIFVRLINYTIIKYSLGGVLLCFSCYFSISYMKKRMDIDVLFYIKSKFKR